MLDKTLPGIMEYIRVKYGETIPSALLSRSVAGLIGSTQIYTLLTIPFIYMIYDIFWGKLVLKRAYLYHKRIFNFPYQRLRASYWRPSNSPASS